MIENIPDGWISGKLGEMCSFKQGTQASINKQFTKYVDGYDRFIRIVDYTQKTDDIRYIIHNPKNTFVSVDEIIMVRYGNIGFIGKGISGVLANNMFKVIPKKSNIANEYLYRYLKYPLIQKMLKNGNSSTIDAINFTLVSKVPFILPPLPQQEKIVKVLDISSALIEKQKDLIANYDLFLKSKFIEMFGDPIKNPMGWEVEKLNKFTTLVSSGSTPKGGQSSYLDEGEIRFVRSQNVRMNKMAYDGISYISEEVYTKMKRSQLKFNDVLLNITGASIGRTAIYKDTTRANVNQHVCIIRLTEELNNEYLSFMISTDSFQNQIISNQSGATREALNYSQIKKFNIPYPQIDLQNKFASIVEQIETIKAKEAKKLEHLETLHKSLMDKAFKGEIG
ncbi:MAG: hypothetical protein COA30_03730 [Sulfurimonas sp.]|nr:MAG: hypothetical protein COA30_03730 [Sulfurimonas sp.]